ncbi:hypothetical protein AGMMS50262_05520 [Bacteroidia bacterium]|nr:hypothetical protein AGMMS50262_05520 [Bacteroidia bacterium]
MRNIKQHIPKTIKKMYRAIHTYIHTYIKKERKTSQTKIAEKVILFLETEKRKNGIDKDKQNILDFLKKHKNKMSAKKYYELIYPYNYTKKYNTDKYPIYRDENNYYIIHNNHKLFFSSEYDEGRVRLWYKMMLMEQDVDSPHKYESEGYEVLEGDIIAEVGTAEGMWTLSSIEKVKKAYLFERDEKWCIALRKTFEPFKDKVVIINKFVSDISNDNSTSIDNFLNGTELNFIKADIDGNEIKLVKGAKDTMNNNNNLRLCLCTYHWQNDADELENYLKENSYQTEFSRGYMIYSSDGQYIPPYLRHGIIRAKKQNIL